MDFADYGAEAEELFRRQALATRQMIARAGRMPTGVSAEWCKGLHPSGLAAERASPMRGAGQSPASSYARSARPKKNNVRGRDDDD